MRDSLHATTLLSTEVTKVKVSCQIKSNLSWIASEIDQWMDHISQSVLPAVNTLLLLEAGGEAALADKRSVSIGMKALIVSLECFEKHLKLRNFVHGY